jgi:hypothetical protein
VIVDGKSKKIIDVRQEKGSVHDFKMFKETIGKNRKDEDKITNNNNRFERFT